MKTIHRRTLLKKVGGLLLPISLGLPLLAKDTEKAPTTCPFHKYRTIGVLLEGEIIMIMCDWRVDLDPKQTCLTYFIRGASDPKFIRYRDVKVEGNRMRWSNPIMVNPIPISRTECGKVTSALVPTEEEVVSPFEFVTITYIPLNPMENSGSEGKRKIRGDIVISLSDGRKFTDSDYESSPRSGDSVCFLTTACTAARGLPDDCMELQILRTFRDGYMMTQASEGPAMIREYYHTAPAVVSAINAREDAAEIHEWLYRDLVIPSVGFIQRGSNAKALDHYAMFFDNLLTGGGQYRTRLFERMQEFTRSGRQLLRYWGVQTDYLFSR